MTASTRAVAPVMRRCRTCPEWVARDLIRHMGGVHRWATSYVAEARSPRCARRPSTRSSGAGRATRSWPTGSRPGIWRSSRRWRRRRRTCRCWTFLPAPSPLAMWSRRQAHETAIHRVDTELTAGRREAELAPFTPDVRRRRRRRAAHVLRAAALNRAALRGRRDARDPLRRRRRGVGADDRARRRDDDGKALGAADCTVRGAAGDLYLALWNRGRGERLSIEGDRGVLDAFGDAVQVRWA